MKAIAAINNLGYIGKDSKMLWNSSEDFKHFKKLTIGKYDQNISDVRNILLVGSTTFKNDLQYKQLISRKTIVIGSSYNTLSAAVRQAYEHQIIMSDIGNFTPDIWVIGGASIYSQLLPLITELHLSHIDDDSIGDTKFINLNNFKGKLIEYYFRPNNYIIPEKISIDSLSKLHYIIKEYLDNANYYGLNSLLEKYMYQDTDINILHTLLVILNQFKYNSILKTNIDAIQAIYNDKNENYL